MHGLNALHHDYFDNKIPFEFLVLFIYDRIPVLTLSSKNMDEPLHSITESRHEIAHRIHVIVTGDDPDAVWSHALRVKNSYGMDRTPRLYGLERSFSGHWFCVLVEQERDL